MAGSAALRGSTATTDSIQRQIMIAASRWLVGAYDTRLVDEVTPVNPDTPPTGLIDIGHTQQDSTLNLTANKFEHRTGLPSSRKKSFIIDRELALTITLNEYSPSNLSRALYDTPNPLKKFAAVPAVFQAPNNITSGNQLNVTTTSTFAINDRVALALSSGALIDTDQDYQIVNITGISPNITLVFDRVVTQTFGTNPWIGKIAGYKVPWATARVCRCALYGIHDSSDGGQYIVCIPRAIVTSGLNGSLGYTENTRLAISFSADGYFDADADTNILAATLRFRARGY